MDFGDQTQSIGAFLLLTLFQILTFDKVISEDLVIHQLKYVFSLALPVPSLRG